MADGKPIQHYVPQFILRNFHSKKNTQIFVFDKTSCKSYCSSIRKVAAEYDFYDIEINGNMISIENALADLEGATSTVVKKIIETESIAWISAEEKMKIANFTAIQMVRTANTKKMFGNIAEILSESLIQGADEQNEIPPLSNDQGTISMINLMIGSEGTMTKALMEKDLFLFKAPKDYPFVISDNPVVRDNNLFQSDVRGVNGLNCKGVEVYLPIAPKLCLAYYCTTIFDEISEGLERAKRLRQIGIPFNSQLLEQMHNAMKKLETQKCNRANVDYYNSLQLFSAESRLFSSLGDFSVFEDQIKKTPELKKPYRLKAN